ncbi:MAG TPA: sulfite exporter TauE/SafE family protein [Miltoncostaeaceae bacterium]|nr:sulfite exporter TauE/SafE family protein [Miltoncostaeaceae bacterium]
MTQVVLLALPLGVLAGAVLGLLGAGGSVLTVPALVYLLDQPVGAATTAALAIVAANAAVGAAENARRGTIDAPLALAFGAAGAGGALAGSYLNRLVSGEMLLALLALVMLASAWSLWRGRPEGGAGLCPRPGPARNALVAALGLAVGVLTGLFGVGGGFLVVPALVLLLGLPVRIAIGTSLLVIAITALAGLGGHLVAGEVSWPLTLVFGAAGAAGVWAGARFGGRLASTTLARAFSAMLVVVALALLAENGAALTG